MTARWTDIDGSIIDVVEPRVIKILRAIARRQGRIARIHHGAIEAHFSHPTQPTTVKITESESDR